HVRGAPAPFHARPVLLPLLAPVLCPRPRVAHGLRPPRLPRLDDPGATLDANLLLLDARPAAPAGQPRLAGQHQLCVRPERRPGAEVDAAPGFFPVVDGHLSARVLLADARDSEDVVSASAAAG